MQDIQKTWDVHLTYAKYTEDVLNVLDVFWTSFFSFPFTSCKQDRGDFHVRNDYRNLFGVHGKERKFFRILINT